VICVETTVFGAVSVLVLFVDLCLALVVRPVARRFVDGFFFDVVFLDEVDGVFAVKSLFALPRSWAEIATVAASVTTARHITRTIDLISTTCPTA